MQVFLEKDYIKRLLVIIRQKISNYEDVWSEAKKLYPNNKEIDKAYLLLLDELCCIACFIVSEGTEVKGYSSYKEFFKDDTEG